MSVNERSALSLPPSFLVRWFHLRSKGSRVTAWPHQIRPNWERCLAQQKGNNLKSIKCKWNCHLPTSKNTWPRERNSCLKLQPHHLLSSGLRRLLRSCLPIHQHAGAICISISPPETFSPEEFDSEPWEQEEWSSNMTIIPSPHGCGRPNWPREPLISNGRSQSCRASLFDY